MGTRRSVRRRDISLPSSLDLLLARLREARFSGGVACPHCGSRRIHRWGSFSGRHRYRCRGGCGRTFSDLTGTPAAYIKKLEQWPAYGAGMLSGEPLAAAARRLDIHPSTAFRWRHRLLAGLLAGDREELGGWVELAMRAFVRSRKGDRSGPWNREPRRRGIAFHWSQAPVAGVVVACDRQGHVITGMVGGWVASTAELDRLLGRRIRGSHADQPPVIMAEQGRWGPQGRFARSCGADYRDARGYDPPRSPLVHVRTAKAYGVRLHRWMRRFRGVATRYLPHYLAWHRWVDRVARHVSTEALLRWPLDPI